MRTRRSTRRSTRLVLFKAIGLSILLVSLASLAGDAFAVVGRPATRP